MMKKILITLVSVILVVSLCSVFASALTINLIPSDAQYDKVDAEVNGEKHTATITFTDGKAVVKSDGLWPSVKALFTGDKVITAEVDKYSLNYDFTVAGGETNITFIFSKNATDPDHGFTFPISNSALKGAEFTQGSGDLKAGTYTGTIKLSDFVNSTKNYVGSDEDGKFSKDYINSKNEIIFSGIQVYSVSGATVTINTLELVREDDPADSSDAESTGSTSSEATSSVATSSEATTSEATSSVAASSADTSSTTPATPSTGDVGVVVVVILAVAAALGSAVVVKSRR